MKTLILAFALCFSFASAHAGQYDELRRQFAQEEAARQLNEQRTKLLQRSYPLNSLRLRAYQTILSKYGQLRNDGECTVTPIDCSSGDRCDSGWDEKQAAYSSLDPAGAYFIRECRFDFVSDYHCLVAPDYQARGDNNFTADCLHPGGARQTFGFRVGGANSPGKKRRAR